MSGDEKRFTVTRGLRFGFDVCDGDEGDKTVLTLVNLSEAHAVAGELNRLAARSGSPEGWPEGAELVPTRDLYRNPDDYEVWSTVASWCGVSSRNWGEVPGGVLVVARRKPKPVTRDVLAWDLEPGMTLANGIEVASVEKMLSDRVKVSFASSEPATCSRTSPWAVLVEEPNG